MDVDEAGRDGQPGGIDPARRCRGPEIAEVAIRPPRIPTSARTAGVPSPFSTEPPAIRRSYGCWAAGRAQAEARRARAGPGIGVSFGG